MPTTHLLKVFHREVAHGNTRYIVDAGSSSESLLSISDCVDCILRYVQKLRDEWVDDILLKFETPADMVFSKNTAFFTNLNHKEREELWELIKKRSASE